MSQAFENFTAMPPDIRLIALQGVVGADIILDHKWTDVLTGRGCFYQTAALAVVRAKGLPIPSRPGGTWTWLQAF